MKGSDASLHKSCHNTGDPLKKSEKTTRNASSASEIPQFSFLLKVQMPLHTNPAITQGIPFKSLRKLREMPLLRVRYGKVRVVPLQMPRFAVYHSQKLHFVYFFSYCLRGGGMPCGHNLNIAIYL